MQFFSYLLLIPQLVAAAAINQRSSGPKALYLLSDDPAGSNIMAIPLSPLDGSMGTPKLISTGGIGLQGINISSQTPSPNDPLFTQDAVTVVDNYLFTFNVGSHTLAMFTINPNDPTNLTLVDTADTQGDFPASVTYSPQLKTACVANGGIRSGVSCFSVDHRKGLKPVTGLMPVGLEQKTHPPVGPFSTISDIVFSPSGKYLMVATKGPSMTVAGSLYIFPVSPSGVISSTPVVSNPEGFDFFIFGFSFLSDTKAYVTDAGFGGQLVSISSTFQVTVDASLRIPGQIFSCWTSYAPRFNSIFLADACIPNITIVDPVTNKLKGFIAQNQDSIGTLAVKLQDHYLYALKADSTLTVADLTGLNNPRNAGKDLPIEAQFQTLNFAPLVKREYLTGLAVYPYFDTADKNPSC